MGNAKICFIGYGKLSELAKSVLSRPEYAKEPILLVDSTVDNLHNIVDMAMQEGCEIFIAGSANAAEFRRYSGAMLIEIKLRPIDYAIAIRKAQKLGKPVVTSYRYSKVIQQSEIACLFDEPIEYLNYQTHEELLEKLQNSNADVVIGASHAVAAAEHLGKKSVFVYPGEDTIADAIRRSCAMINMLKKERRNNKFIHTIISESKTGIVGFSERREVVIINAAARKFTGLSIGQARHSRLRQLISDEEFQQMIDQDKKSSYLIKHIGGHTLKLQLLEMNNKGRSLGTLLLIDKLNKEDEYVHPEQALPTFNLTTFRDIVCLSPAMKKTVSSAKLYANRPNAPILITGEHGTGKQLMAQSIHSFFRSDIGDYVSINCAAALDNETARFFFNSRDEKPETAQKYAVDLSNVGTLVLENIWEASEKLQANILWMTYGKLDRIFISQKPKRLQTSVITIIPSDKWDICKQNVRADLLQRLQTFILTVPPLRKRKEDIAALFFRYLYGNLDYSRPVLSKDSGLLPVLTNYSWPGNVSELRNVSQRYALEFTARTKLTRTGKKRLLIDCIGEQKLYDDILEQLAVPQDVEKMNGEQLTELTDKLKELLLYNNEQIAEKLGISRTSMWRKMRQSQT